MDCLLGVARRADATATQRQIRLARWRRGDGADRRREAPTAARGAARAKSRKESRIFSTILVDLT